MNHHCPLKMPYYSASAFEYFEGLSPALRPAPHDLALSLLVRAPGVGYEMHTHR